MRLPRIVRSSLQFVPSIPQSVRFYRDRSVDAFRHWLKVRKGLKAIAILKEKTRWLVIYSDESYLRVDNTKHRPWWTKNVVNVSSEVVHLSTHPTSEAFF